MASAKLEDMTHLTNISAESNVLDGIDNKADSHDLRVLRALRNGRDDLVKILLDQHDDLDCGHYEEQGRHATGLCRQ